MLASLPDSFSMLVTALEANEEVSKMKVVAERILHEEGSRRRKIILISVHKGNDQSFFVEYESLKTPLKVTIGDGYEIDVTILGVVILTSVLPSGESEKCTLQNVLYVPRLCYNLFSVSVTTERGKTVRFSKDSCQVLDEGKLVAVATKGGELYYLNFHVSGVCSNAAESKVTESKEDRWHH